MLGWTNNGESNRRRREKVVNALLNGDRESEYLDISQ